MAIRSFFSVLVAIMFSGCAGTGTPITTGLLYTNIILPHSTDFQSTPVGTKRCVLDEHELKDPVSGGYSVAWTAAVIRAATKEAVNTNISFTETQTVSFLLGTYSRRRLVIYGD